jgi:hypothetical protein
MAVTTAKIIHVARDAVVIPRQLVGNVLNSSFRLNEGIGTLL